jgi:hypothetical protein
MIWCPKCQDVKPVEFCEMLADAHNKNDAVDVLCGDCAFIVATLHADPDKKAA